MLSRFSMVGAAWALPLYESNPEGTVISICKVIARK
jgi:hypothetical protein